VAFVPPYRDYAEDGMVNRKYAPQGMENVAMYPQTYTWRKAVLDHPDVAHR
jgi:hypothetical protein